MQQLTATKTYHQSNIYIFVKAGDPYTPFEVLFYPFGKRVWSSFVLSCVLRFTLICCHWRFVKNLPRPFRRFLLGMWFILMFYYRSLYEASYFTYMRDRPLKPLPRSIADFNAESYKIICDESTCNFVELLDVDKSRIVRYRTEPKKTFMLLQNLRGKYGVLAKKEYFHKYLQLQALGRNELFMIPETLVISLLCMYLPRYSHFISYVDSVVGNLRNFGIIEKFVRDFVNLQRVPLTTDRRNFRRLPAHDFRPLYLTDLHGVFLLMGCSWLLGGWLFLAEFFTVKFPNLRRLFDRF